MKTTILRTVIFAMIALFVCVSMMNAQEPFYDTKWENGKIDTRTRYALGYSGLYEKSMLSEYFYDESGDFYMKIISRWDRRKECWVPDYRILHQKNEISGIVSIEHASWDAKKQRYNEPHERMLYQINESQDRFFYLAFEKGNRFKEWVNAGLDWELIAEILDQEASIEK